MKPLRVLFAVVLLPMTHSGVGQTTPAATNLPSVIPSATHQPALAPAVLPGKGLGQHDFFYAGEAKDERLFIVRGGEVVWSYTHPGHGEISDATLEPDGNILFARQFGVTEVNLDKRVVWNYDAPPKTEIHTAQPHGTPEKKVVWALSQWKNPDLGPASSIQLLDEPGVPEDPGDQQR